jgi:hypothetical protein
MNSRNKVGSVLAGVAMTATARRADRRTRAGLGSPHIRLIISGVHPMQEPGAVGYITHLGEGSCGGMLYTVFADENGTEKYKFDRNFPGTFKGPEGICGRHAEAWNTGVNWCSRRAFSTRTWTASIGSGSEPPSLTLTAVLESTTPTWPRAITDDTGRA